MSSTGFTSSAPRQEHQYPFKDQDMNIINVAAVVVTLAGVFAYSIA
jgi:hypothetical protein